MNKEFGSFRKMPFGGFNRKDVINYIEKMRNESFEYKKQVDETVKNLNEKIRELENAARLMESPAVSEAEAVCAEPSQESFGDIGVATEHLKTVADELCRSLGDFMDKLSEKGLFEKASQESCSEDEEAQEADEEKEISFVDGVLASISYFDASEPETKNEAEEKAQQINISDLLSGYSFTK